jgi:hypothetical protein
LRLKIVNGDRAAAIPAVTFAAAATDPFYADVVIAVDFVL